MMFRLLQFWMLIACVSVVMADEKGQDKNGKGETESPPLHLDAHHLGENTEQISKPNARFTLWIQDETFFRPAQEDRVEIKKVLKKEAKTFKLKNAIRPIGFKAGKADIPDSLVEKLRDVLKQLKNRQNVRIHFIGHTDNQKLGPASKAKYGDNLGLSKARAGMAAEFFQRELDLPPEAVSYDGAGDSQPIASNKTAEGRARNRRVEVQVWYDDITETMEEKKVVVAADKLNRIKVCRQEVVCKLHYREGSAKRARLKNLVSPLRMEPGQTEIPAEFIRQIREAFKNLKDQKNVVIRFVGHTDNLPLEDRELRIYGDHLGLSKARARRVAVAIQDALHLSNRQVSSTGKGASRPLASNDTARGRRLNRRIEVEFWHDDPFEKYTADAQACPEAAAAETVTLAYDPPTGPIKPIFFKKGQPIISDAYVQRLQKLLQEVSDKSHVRLSFTGYTNNERLNRRVAMVYGDDIGLSTARAKRVMEKIKADLKLDDKQVQYEGMGFVHSKDVVKTGFVQFDSSRVEVAILYDELAVLDEQEGLEIERIKQTASIHNPYALNYMRITVDGEPLYDPYKNLADLQRCSDVALNKADIRFRFDRLHNKPRLNISAYPPSIPYADNKDTDIVENRMVFKAYSNYASFIQQYEVRIFKEGDSTRDKPLAVIELNKNQQAEWLPNFDELLDDRPQGVIKLQYVLRVYDREKHFDETRPQTLWVLNNTDEKTADIKKELLIAYGENHLGLQNIPLEGGTITVDGKNIPKDHSVWVAGDPVPVNDAGQFVSEQIYPAGFHTLEVAVLDREGNGELYLREVELKQSDWFYVGIADITASKDNTNGPASLVTGDQVHYDNDLSIDGRLAYYVNGKFGDDWELTSSADTREGPLNEIFSNFVNKSPDMLFRRLDPDYYYPTFGDDSTLEEGAPTLGKFYLKLRHQENYGVWGNFNIEYLQNELAQIDRGLYGLNGHYESDEATSFGEKELVLDGFAAEPGTVAGRDEFRGTGGSLYFMRHQDILVGSERLRIEVRDKDSGIVIGVKNLTPAIDYDIDYIQGRLLLSDPLASIASDNLLVDSGSFSGNPVFLVARYEYTPGFDDINTLAVGGSAEYWINPQIKIGATSSRQKEDANENTLNGMDITLRKSAGSWLKLQLSNTTGQGAGALNSNNGGFNFTQLDTGLNADDSANAYRLEGRLRLDEFIENSRGNSTFYIQKRDAGFSAPGQLTATEINQFGATVDMYVTSKIKIKAKADKKDQPLSLNTSSLDFDVSYKLDENWRFSAGGRADTREDKSINVAATQRQGTRFDAALQASYDSTEDWMTYGFVQGTVNNTGNRAQNNRVGGGGSYQLSDRFKVDGELSLGGTGTGAKLGTDYLVSDRSNVYLNYALDNERSFNGLRSRRGNMVSGYRNRYSDSASLYVEEKYSHGDIPTGLTHAFGVELAPDERWNYGGSFEMGQLRDDRSGTEIARKAMALTLGYGVGRSSFASALEYRIDNTTSADGTEAERISWLTKNSMKYQLNPDWRFIGKLNYSDSKSSQGDFYNGKFTEAVLGYAYRPVLDDRWNSLFKYTYFYNVPTQDQVSIKNTAATFIQKSHVLSLDSIYDISQRWSLGGKLAYRLGQLAQERINPQFFDSSALLYVLRADWHFVHRWDALIEARMLDLPEAQDSRSGMLLGIYRHLGKNIKFGVGYNFTDFSDDLTDLSYDSQGVFINLIGKI